jgi:hypothetical protein
VNGRFIQVARQPEEGSSEAVVVAVKGMDSREKRGNES